MALNPVSAASAGSRSYPQAGFATPNPALLTGSIVENERETTMANPTDLAGARRTLSEIAVQLQGLAEALWIHADDAGLDSPLHPLALGCFLAAAQATSLIPTTKQLPGLAQTTAPTDPAPALRAIYDRAAGLDPRIVGGADLTIAIAGLVREATGCAA